MPKLVSLIRRFRWFALVLVLGVVADLWTKVIVFDALGVTDEAIQQAVELRPEFPTAALHQIAAPRQIELAEHHLYLTVVLNAGAFGGILGGQAGLLIVLALVAVVVVVGVILLAPGTTVLRQIIAGGIIAGAIGNIYDRVTFGCVRDYMDFRWPETGIGFLNPWNTFNVADSLISVGIVAFIALELFRRSVVVEPAPAAEPGKSAAAGGVPVTDALDDPPVTDALDDPPVTDALASEPAAPAPASPGEPAAPAPG